MWTTVLIVNCLVAAAACGSHLALSGRAQGLRGRGARRDADRDDLYDSAFLAGGPARVADIALLALRERGGLTVGPGSRIRADQARPVHPVEHVLADRWQHAPGGRSLSRLRTLVMRSPEVREIGDRLASCGLLLHPRHDHARRITGGLLAVLFLATLLTALWAPNPVPFIALGGGCLAVLLLFLTPARPTPPGRRRLKWARRHAPWSGSELAPVVFGGPAAVPDETLRATLQSAARRSALLGGRYDYDWEAAPGTGRSLTRLGRALGLDLGSDSDSDSDWGHGWDGGGGFGGGGFGCGGGGGGGGGD
ncbi:TIGR04222 domain-containing membrane protein [Streptomyces sp. NPDC051219]|uniref:TIGR04222 domain-containing membrane protein n=1 Tax=Streptomyces sp. NPDC051219 TaxID=3155283 RepID=UPI003423152E